MNKRNGSRRIAPEYIELEQGWLYEVTYVDVDGQNDTAERVLVIATDLGSAMQTAGQALGPGYHIVAVHELGDNVILQGDLPELVDVSVDPGDNEMWERYKALRRNMFGGQFAE